MLSQKQAVKRAVLKVLPDYELNGEVILNDVLTSDHKTRIVDMVVDGFLAGEVEMSPEGKIKYFSNKAELRKYTVGLVNNWIRKDTEFNNGAAYQTKNPGSRSGSGDPQLKALRQVLKGTTDATIKARVEAAIESRIRELQPKVEIDFDSLPDEIKKLLK